MEGNAGNPYAAPDAQLPDLPSDAEIADAVALHDRYPLLARVVGDNFGLYARRWKLDRPEGGWARPWHWPALLFDFYWLMYRKMYLAGFVYLGITFVAGAVMAFVPQLEALAVFLLLGFKLALAISANELYRWHCRRLIARVQSRHVDAPERLDAVLRRKGGTSGVALGVAIALMFVITLLGEA